MIKRFIFLALGIVLLTAGLCFGQGLYKTISPGDSVTLAWDFPDAQRTQIKYFRVRKGQTPAGAYIAFAKVAPTESTYTFVPAGSCHVFVSAVYEEVQAGGTVIMKETVGSNHVQVTVK